MVSANMVRKYIYVKMSGDEVEWISFKKFDNDDIELDKSQGFMDMMGNIFQTILHQVTGTSKKNKWFKRVILCQEESQEKTPLMTWLLITLESVPATFMSARWNGMVDFFWMS